MQLVLFDIDGTLMVGYGAGTRAMLRAGRAVCGDAFDLEGVMIGGGLDPVIFAEAAKKMGMPEIASTLHDAFRDRYLRELVVEFETAAQKPHVLPGVTELLAELAKRQDVIVGLVTGNFQRAVPLKFAAVGLGIASFAIGAYGDCGPTRPELVRLARERAAARAGAAIDPQRTFIVGDTPRDVHCALANGCMCLAVGTGGHSLDELQRAGAHRVAPNLSDPDSLLSLLSG